MRSKIKGMSLIEVVVSLSLLAITFAGTITLIVAVTNLAMISREKTEATGILQKGLSKGVDRAKNACIGASSYNDSLTEKYNSDKYTLEVTNSDSFTELSSSNTSDKINGTNFVLVKSEVKWNYKGQDYQISANQYVSKVKE